MKLFDFRKKDQKTAGKNSVSGFFINASEEEKKELIRRVAEQANKDQMETYKQASLKLRISEQG